MEEELEQVTGHNLVLSSLGGTGMCCYSHTYLHSDMVGYILIEKSSHIQIKITIRIVVTF